MTFATLRPGLWAAIVGSAILISPARADLYLSNTGQPNWGGYVVNGDVGFGQQFRTGTSAAGYTLNSISLGMDAWSGTVSGFQVSIYSNSGGLPAAQMEVLAGNNTPGIGVYAYTSSGITLNPSTYYWAVVTVASSSGSSSGYFWDITKSLSYDSSDGWQIPFGNSFGMYTVATHQWSALPSSSAYTFQFAVDATLVPEPGSSVLMVLSLGCLGLWRVVRPKASEAKVC